MSARGSTSGKEATPTLTSIQAIAVQERNTMVKAPDLYYKDRSKLDSFLMSIDIYILFNQYLFRTKTAKIIYTISYLKGIVFN
jgi:hypothetical protein